MKKRYRRPLRIKRKKPLFKKTIFFAGLFFFIIFSGFLAFLFFTEFFSVKKIDIFGQENLNKDELLPTVEKSLVKSFFNFETKNILLTSKEKIKKELLNKFPQIEKIEIKIKLPNTLQLKIKERKEVAIFCQEENCYFLDREGIIFEKLNENSSLLKIFSLAFLGELKIGEKVIEEDLLEKILNLEKKLKEIEISVLDCKVISESRLNFKTTESWEIFIDPQKDLDWQVTKLKIALEEAIPKEKREKLEYIDLRFGNFAYPKYKE